MRAVLPIAILVLGMVGPFDRANADDFMAMPGLWLTTLKELQPAGASGRASASDWHCVDDEVDPWTSFVPAPEHVGDQCARTTSERTATSLKWHMECKGSAMVASDGLLQFDSAQHYTGSIVEIRNDGGHRVVRRLAIEGQRRAACTTPED